MPEITVYFLNAFIEKNGGGGNPAAVVWDADRIPSQTRQSLAADLGLSETAFVSLLSDKTPRIEFFTPTHPIAHCGHATLAVFHLLAEQGLSPIQKKEMSYPSADGPRRIRFLDEKRIFMEQNLPVYENVSEDKRKDLLKALKIEPAQLTGALPIQIASSGNRFALIPVKGARDLALVQPDFDALNALSRAWDLVGVYLFSLETQRPERHASARMFAPRYGIREEAATGTAAGPLGGYLWRTAEMKQSRFVLEQGGAMAEPRLSKIEVMLEHDNNTLKELWVGGCARLTATQQKVI